MPDSASAAARERALHCARRIFRKPPAVVDALLATFAPLSDDTSPGRSAVIRAWYERPIRMGATREVLSLRAHHWPMLNLLDAADAERRAFADAAAHAVEAQRAGRA